MNGLLVKMIRAHLKLFNNDVTYLHFDIHLGWRELIPAGKTSAASRWSRPQEDVSLWMLSVTHVMEKKNMGNHYFGTRLHELCWLKVIMLLFLSPKLDIVNGRLYMYSNFTFVTKTIEKLNMIKNNIINSVPSIIHPGNWRVEAVFQV